MSWSKRALPVLAGMLWFAVPSHAQVGGHPIEVSAGAGLFKYDTRSHMERGLAFTGAIGWRAAPYLTFEGFTVLGPSKADTAPQQDHNFSLSGIDMRWNLRPADGEIVPFILTGFGYATSSTVGHVPDKLDRGALTLGLGLLHSLGNPRTYVRVQVRDVFFRDREAIAFSNHFAATAGVHVVLKGTFEDADRDGVRDWLDKAPNTPIGAKVDADGRPDDPDRDSVFTGIDQCPDTPAGCVVDGKGCPVDSDGDGVCDGIDACADTPKGCTVNATGCPSDADGDAVCDGVDQCADTPKGCPVDGKGCSTDTDGDGVCDGVDQCVNTPTGTAVSATGCPTEIGAFERALLDSGVVRVRGLRFEGDPVTISAEATAVMDSIGRVLQQYPDLKIEIGGPTDVTGAAGVKERLSLAQTRAMVDYFKAKFPLMSTSMFTMRGTSAAPAEAPRILRRAEFKVTNPDKLPAERAKRGLGGASE